MSQKDKFSDTNAIKVAQTLYGRVQAKLLEDPRFQKAAAQAVLNGQISKDHPEIDFEIEKGIQASVKSTRRTDSDQIEINRRVMDGEGPYVLESDYVTIGIHYEQVYDGSCQLWGGRRGKPVLGVVQHYKMLSGSHEDVPFEELCKQNDRLAIQRTNILLKNIFG